jgi:hypothetical protein
LKKKYYQYWKTTLDLIWIVKLKIIVIIIIIIINKKKLKYNYYYWRKTKFKKKGLKNIRIWVDKLNIIVWSAVAARLETLGFGVAIRPNTFDFIYFLWK